MLHSLTLVLFAFCSLANATGLVDVRRHAARYPVPGTLPVTLQDPQKRAEGLYERQACLEQQNHCDFGRCCFGDCCVNACCPPGYRCHIVGDKHGCCFAGVNCSDYFEGCVYSSGVQCEGYGHCCPAGQACGLDANGNATCDGQDAIAGLNPRNPYTPTGSASSTTSTSASTSESSAPPSSSSNSGTESSSSSGTSDSTSSYSSTSSTSDSNPPPSPPSSTSISDSSPPPPPPSTSNPSPSEPPHSTPPPPSEPSTSYPYSEPPHSSPEPPTPVPDPPFSTPYSDPLPPPPSYSVITPDNSVDPPTTITFGATTPRTTSPRTTTTVSEPASITLATNSGAGALDIPVNSLSAICMAALAAILIG